jgi:undecaprenyl-diphosphatase
MNAFDLNLMTYINQFSQYSWRIDKMICFLSDSRLFKGGVLITIAWWAWFKSDERQLHNREHIISTMFCCFLAPAFTKILAVILPFRFRPLHEKSLVFVVPYGMERTILDGWSSFPSDHAVLFFTLSAGLLFVSGKAGAFALAYTALFIALPRIYLGLHYPTDIIAGAFIGITTALFGNIYLVSNKILKSVATRSYSNPDFFYPVFFLLTYQIADMFNGFRSFLSGSITFLLS